MSDDQAYADTLEWSPAVRQLLELALQEDLSHGDVTTQATGLRGDALGTIVARQPLRCCGLQVAEWLAELMRAGLRVERLATEGQQIAAGAPLATIAGPVGAILRAERTVLNFLARMCGVATLAQRYVQAVAGTGARIADTRKTVPGWRVLDKYAARVGGAANHRFDLGSGILIKDNHIAAAGSAAVAVRRAIARAPHPLRVEIEIETLEQLEPVLEAGAEVLLLDNMSPAQVARAVERVAGRALVEVSGGIDLQSVRAYAEAGPDLISVGALTHSAPAADLSLDLDGGAARDEA